MFLCVEGNHYRISDQAGGQVLAEIPGPSIQEEGQTFSAEAAGFRYYDSILSEKDGLFLLKTALGKPQRTGAHLQNDNPPAHAICSGEIYHALHLL